MAAPRRPGGPKQKLSPKARAAKIKRDEKTAMTPRRTKIKAENQRKRRAAIKKGENVKGKDYDHNTGRFVSARKNRSATKTTNNTMPNKLKKKIASSKTPKKPTKMTAKHKAAGKKFMAKGSRPGTTRKAQTEVSKMAKSPAKKKIGFKALSSKIQKEGKSKESADAIAASIGRKKYGKAGMAKKAAAGRKSPAKKVVKTSKPTIKSAAKKGPLKRLTKSGKPAGVKKMGAKRSTIKGMGRKKK